MGVTQFPKVGEISLFAQTHQKLTEAKIAAKSAEFVDYVFF